MNKLIKKSMAGLLAGVMVVSSLAVGLTATAATVTPISQGQAVSFQGAEPTKGADDKWVYNNEAVYSFTPAETGYYAVSLSSTPYIAESDKESGYRSDYASLGIYEEYDAAKESFDKNVGYISSKMYLETSVINTVDSSKNKYTYTYLNGYESVKLRASKTYYLKLETYPTKYNTETGKYEYTAASFSVAPTDFKADIYMYDDTTEDTAAKTKTTVEKAYCEVYYVGYGADVVVPDEIDGAPVENVYGTENPNITSLTLGKNVKNVRDFSELDKLASLTLNDALETIGEYSFYGDAALTGKLVIPASVKSVGEYAFYNCGYDTVQVLGAATEIGTKAFGFETQENKYTVNPTDTIDEVKDGFILVAPAGSNAAAYAAKNGIAAYDPANHAHVYAVTASAEGTYFKSGTQTKTCRVCGAAVTEATEKKTPVIKSVKAKKGQLTVKTKALDAKVTGYQIQVSTSKKFKKKATKTITVKTNSKKALNKTIKGLKKGKYYVRVRVYKGKKKGAFTAAKAIKVK